MALAQPDRLKTISTAKAGTSANSSYVAGVYLTKYGRVATAAEQAKFAGKTVDYVSNIVLGTESPYQVKAATATAKPTTTASKTATTSTAAKTATASKTTTTAAVTQQKAPALLAQPERLTAISKANPQVTANSSFISGVYLAKYGRVATAAEQAKFAGKTTAEVANLVMGLDSPFQPNSTNYVGNTKTATKSAATGTSTAARKEEKQLSDAEKIAVGARPTVPDLVSKYNEMLADNSIPSMETKLSDLDAELTSIDDAYTAGQNKIESGLAPMEVLSGRSKELEQQYQERRATVLREREDIANRLQTKYNTVNTMMELTGQQYSLALEDYNARFTQNLQTQQYLDSKADAAQTAARANLSTIISGFQESGKTWSEMSDSLKTQVYKMELEAGLPGGTTEAFLDVMPQATLLATVNGTDSSGNDIITFVYADENGNPGTIQTVKTGGYTKTSSGSGTGVNSEYAGDIEAYANAILDASLNGESFDISQIPSEIRGAALSRAQTLFAEMSQQEVTETPTTTGTSPIQELKNRGASLIEPNNPIGKVADKVGNFFSGLFN
jgi:citrate synthase